MAVVGVVLLASGMVFTWLDVPIQPQRRATSLPLVFAGMPSAGVASYGTLVALAVVVAVWRLVVARGRVTWGLAVVGAAAMLIPILFVVESVLSDAKLIQHLNQQQVELTTIVNQLGYKVPRSRVSALLFIPLKGSWRLLITALRPGWYLTLVGGATLFASGFPELVAACQHAPRRAILATTTALLVVGVFMGRGIVANLVVNSATSALTVGDYNTAVSQLDFAERLNPDLQYSSEVALARGQALEAGGNRTSALALLFVARIRRSSSDLIGALTALQEAARAEPDNVVVTADLERTARLIALRSNDPGPLQALVRRSYGDRPAAHYTLGRVLYERGDYESALSEMKIVASEASEDANVASSAHTYIALCDFRLGNSLEGHKQIQVAISLDTEYINSLARSLATGLYISGGT